MVPSSGPSGAAPWPVPAGRSAGHDRLRLYHEVTVAAAEDQLFEYLCCHPGTGLLRVLPAKTAG
jgi:hypothetical protein